jgi:D-xylose transport system permease protein
VVFTGTTLGAVGSAVGLGLGIAAAFPIHPYLDRLAGRYVGPIDVPWVPLLGAFALGTVASTVAASLPARTASKISVLQALAERTPPPRRPGRIAAGGVMAVVVGAAIALWGSGPTVSAKHAWILTGGIVGMIVGILVGIPMLVSWTGRLAGVLPTLARIAARNIARNGRRTGAALAAGAIALYAGGLFLGRRQRAQAGLESDPLAVDAVKLTLVGASITAAVAILNADRGVPLAAVIVVSLVVLFTFITERTRYGRHIFAVGGNQEAARRAGIRINRVKVSVFALASTLAAAGGVLAASRLLAVNQQSGSGDVLLLAIAGPVIAGTSLFGGRGFVWSALLGAIVIGSISNGMDLLALDSDIKFMITGAVLLLAVTIDAATRLRRQHAG